MMQCIIVCIKCKKFILKMLLEAELCFALLLFGLYAAFTALFIVCDMYLIPAVEVFINAYNIPEEV